MIIFLSKLFSSPPFGANFPHSIWTIVLPFGLLSLHMTPALFLLLHDASLLATWRQWNSDDSFPVHSTVSMSGCPDACPKYQPQHVAYSASGNPSSRQTTRASSKSHASSQILPHWRFMNTSIFPDPSLWEGPVSLIWGTSKKGWDVIRLEWRATQKKRVEGVGRQEAGLGKTHQIPNDFQLCPVCTMTRNRVWHLPKIWKFSYNQFVLILKPCSHLRRAN